MLWVRRCTGGAVSIRARRWEGWERKESLAGTSARIPCKTLLPIFMFLSQQLAAWSCGYLAMPNRFAL